jgi:N-acetylglucosamine kinase-like BadF-type ATPase
LTYWMGIDGGGSTLRVAIVRDDLQVVAQANGDTVSPSLIGREAAGSRIRAAIQAALDQAQLHLGDLSGAGVGIAGASVIHSEAWLREAFSNIMPGVPFVPSSDLEIALVGALGERQGVLVLAGTGSAGFGINRAGQSIQVGGWGYLLGDEGSSYWIGMRTLQMLTRLADGREDIVPGFSERFLNVLGLKSEMDLIPWLYHSEQPRTRDIAQLARIVIGEATNGVQIAVDICDQAAQELVLLCRTIIRRLELQNPQIAFAGGLLDNDNFLSSRLCSLLELEKRPVPLYPPVIGAALLAQIVSRS